MRISAIIKAIEEFAPLSYQESWDNSGLQVGNTAGDCTGVLLCLDVTPAIVDEAATRGCNLIVSHHPLIFKPLKRITGSTPQQVAAMNAIARGITIYSTHTASDSTVGGVSYELAIKLGVRPLRALDPLADRLVMLRVMVPADRAEEVRAALFDAGAGALGCYDQCSFNTEGTGTFRALEGANPFVGEQGEVHQEHETAVEVVLRSDLIPQVESALLDVHPYETPAYAFLPMLNRLHDRGIGIYGVNELGFPVSEFLEMVKRQLGCKVLRTNVTGMDKEEPVRRVAVCGGAGGSLIPAAIRAGAQVYITADIRYNDFVDNTGSILIVDAGHYETEKPITEVLLGVIKTRFPDIAAYISGVESNPVEYII